MPAQTASRRAAYSSAVICGTMMCLTPLSTAGRGGFLVRGKFSHRLRDLGRVGHEEFLLRSVERHGRDVWAGHTHDGPVQAVETVLRDDGRDLGSETAGEVVLRHHHRLTRLPHRLPTLVPAHRPQP